MEKFLNNFVTLIEKLQKYDLKMDNFGSKYCHHIL